MSSEFAAHFFDARIKRRLQPGGDRRLHQLLARKRDALVGSLRNRRCRARGKTPCLRRRRGSATVRIAAGSRIDRQPGIAAAGEQILKRCEQVTQSARRPAIEGAETESLSTL